MQTLHTNNASFYWGDSKLRRALAWGEGRGGQTMAGDPPAKGLCDARILIDVYVYREATS